MDIHTCNNLFIHHVTVSIGNTQKGDKKFDVAAGVRTTQELLSK